MRTRRCWRASATSAEIDDAGGQRSVSAARDGAVKGDERHVQQKRPNILYTVDLKTGEIKIVHRVDTWLGHVQWSPTDPSLVMFCHEGPWDKLDRIWTYRLGESEPRCCSICGRSRRRSPGTSFGRRTESRSGFRTRSRVAKRATSPARTSQRASSRSTACRPSAAAIHEIHSYDGNYFVADGGGKEKTGPNKYMSVLTINSDAMKSTRLFSLQENDYAQAKPEPAPHARSEVADLHRQLRGRTAASVGGGDAGAVLAEVNAARLVVPSRK